MIAPELFGLSPPGKSNRDLKIKEPENNGDFSLMLDKMKADDSTEKAPEDVPEKRVVEKPASRFSAAKSEKALPEKENLEKNPTVKSLSEKVPAEDATLEGAMATNLLSTGKLDQKDFFAENAAKKMQEDLYKNSLQSQSMMSMIPQSQDLYANPVLMNPVLMNPALTNPSLMSPSLANPMLTDPKLAMPMFMQSPQIMTMQQKALLMSQQPMSEKTGVPSELVFSPNLNNYVCDGLVELLNGAEKAGVTDGKEIVNLINKMVSEFNLDRDKVTEEFNKVADMNAKQKADFTLGVFFKNVGLEDNQLDKAYAVINEVVARDSLKQSICNAKKDPSNQLIANKDDRLDELMLTSSYLDKKMPMMNQKVLAPYTGMRMNQIGKNPFEAQNFSTATRFEDLMLQQNSSDPTMFNVGMQNDQFKVQDFSHLKPVTNLNADQVANPAVLRDSLVTDAKLLVRDGGGKMEITLRPDHMGKIEIKVDTQLNRVNIEVMCTNPQVKHMVESQMFDLKVAMAGSNLVADKINVTLASNSSSGGNFNESTEQHASKRGFNEHARDNWERQNSRKQNNREFQFA